MLPEPLGSWIHWLYELLRQNDEKALFLLLLVEEAGVPLPAPGDVVIMLAGYRASLGDMDLWEAGLAVTLAVQMGSTILYLISRKLGHGLLFKYGKYIHLNQARLKRVEGWIQRRGPIMVLVGRLTPGLRTPTSVVAGVFGVPFHQFLFFTTLSAIIWSVFWLLLGYFFGKSLIPLARFLHHPLLYVAIALGLLAGWLGFYLWRRRQRSAERGEISGIVRVPSTDQQG